MRDVTNPVPDDALTRVAAAALREVDPLVGRLMAIITARLPELARDPRVRDLLATTVGDNVVSALRMVLSDSHELTDVAPPVALEFARLMAQQGVPITAMVRAYRLGQAAFQQEMIARIAQEPVGAADIAAATMQLSALAFSYIDKVSEDVVEAYQLERDAWLQHRNAARLAKVIEMLSGPVADAHVVETVLGYRLARHHVGAVLWCAEHIDPLTVLERHLTQLAAALGCTASALSVAPDASTLWVWFPTSSVSVEAVGRVLTEAGDGVLAALGDPAEGPAGFRDTHLQARQAQTIALAARPVGTRPVTAASELGPLALLGSDTSVVSRWVQSVLGHLAEDDVAHARMRATAWAYLSSGGSLSAAAAELHLHRNTIQYRIGKAEESRGRPFGDGRLDVEVALLACRLLGEAVLRPIGDVTT